MAKKPRTSITHGPKVGDKKQYDSIFVRHVTHLSNDEGNLGSFIPGSDSDYIAGKVREAELLLRERWPNLPHPVQKVFWWKAEDRWEPWPDDAGLEDTRKGGQFYGANWAMGFALYPTDPLTVEECAVKLIFHAWCLQNAFENQDVDGVLYNTLRFQDACGEIVRHQMEHSYLVGQDVRNKVLRMLEAQGLLYTEEFKKERARDALKECLRVAAVLEREHMLVGKGRPSLEKIRLVAGTKFGLKPRQMWKLTKSLKELLGR